MSDIKLQRTIARFQAKIDGGAYYEAHQTLRTITNRYVKSKQYTEAIDLLYQGASILAQKKEYGSASDLITYLIQVLEEAEITCTKDYKMKLIDLINLLPDTDVSLADLAKQSISWSTKGSDSKFGDTELHSAFGVKFCRAIYIATGDEEERAKLFAYAELHLILGTHESLPYYVDFLYSWYEQQNDPTIDPGVFLARAVMNYSYLKNFKFVNEAATIFIDKLNLKVSNFEKIDANGSFIYNYKGYELLNFLQLLIITLGKSDSQQKFLKLYSQYKPVLTHFELLAPVEYLAKLYYNVQLGNPNGNQNMLANLMGGLFK
ncbi:golgi to ER traffic protein 4 [[Candida] anglica]|uniref:Golgi to ER traffic protein 4 n=1 Tax=[Candida] anglica TaxID=148631 RepID=A0ABP0EPD0_9ASCO